MTNVKLQITSTNDQAPMYKTFFRLLELNIGPSSAVRTDGGWKFIWDLDIGIWNFHKLDIRH
jgi:hypothetical protein